jgi:hypothetical protein
LATPTTFNNIPATLTFHRKNTVKSLYFIDVVDVVYIVAAIMFWPDRCLEFSTL